MTLHLMSTTLTTVLLTISLFFAIADYKSQEKKNPLVVIMITITYVPLVMSYFTISLRYVVKAHRKVIEDNNSDKNEENELLSDNV